MAKKKKEKKEEKKERKTQCIDASKKLVLVRHVSRDKRGRKYHLTNKVDLSDLSDESILELATQTILIRWLRKNLFEKLDTLAGYDNQTIKASVYQPERRVKSRLEKADTTISRMSWNEFVIFCQKFGADPIKSAPRFGITVPKKK
jgi:hypothetical protein